MASLLVSKFSYKKLQQEVIFEENDYLRKSNKEKLFELIKRTSSVRLRSKRRKFRVKFGGFRRFFRIKRFKVARLSWAKVLKRLKESQAHFGDLFAGNYLFMQVTPASLKNKNLVAQNLYTTTNNNLSISKLSGFNTSSYSNYAICG